MKLKTGFLILGLLFAGIFPSWGQTLLGKAAGDFFSVYAKLGKDQKQLKTLADLDPYITDDVRNQLGENLVYRVAFTGYAANQLGILEGITRSAGFAETLNALTGFIMVIEKSDELKEWTIKEISSSYEQLIASSWRNANASLFVVMLEAYCSYKRGEIWQ